MYSSVNKSHEEDKQPISGKAIRVTADELSNLQYDDQRAKTLAQIKFQEKANNRSSAREVTQLQSLADKYISSKNPIQRIENLSGYSMDDVKQEKELDFRVIKPLGQSSSQKTKSIGKEHHISNGIVQRVKNLDEREMITDPIMNDLYIETLPLLKQIAEMKIVEEEKAEEGRAMGESIAEGASEKLGEIYHALLHPDQFIQSKAEELAKKALKDYWKSLTTEEKIDVALEGARTTISVLSTMANAALSSSSNDEKKSSNRSMLAGLIGSSKKSKLGKEVTNAFLTGLSQISADDLQALWTAWREKEKAKNEISKAKGKFDKEMMSISASAGQKIGAAQGEIADFLTQQKLKASIKPKLDILETKFHYAKTNVVKKMRENEDFELYQNELAVYSDTLDVMHGADGPFMVVTAGLGIDLDGMKQCKAKAKSYLSELISFKSIRDKQSQKDKKREARSGTRFGRIQNSLGF